MKSTVAASVAAVALLSGSADAFWRMPCHSRTAFARIDPIVDPGVVSSHGHVIHGGSRFTETTTYDDLRASNCTSCGFKDDKSAYWTPSLHFIYDNGTTVVVPQIGGMLAYYLLLGEGIEPFPEGFQLLAGDSRLRNFTGPVPDKAASEWPEDAENEQPALAQKSLGFNCMNYDRKPEGSRFRHFMPDKEFLDTNCKDGLRAEIFFPSCWNGQPPAPDHKSHMAYPHLIDGGICPPEFDRRLPSLFYETIWNTYAFKDDNGKFVWSNGDPTGYGYHADFINGWDFDVLESAIKKCTNPSGRVEDCEVFAKDLQSEAEQGQCKIEAMPKALSVDDCEGPSNGLCGNVPIQFGPEYADPLEAGEKPNPTGILSLTKSAAPVPTQSYAPARSKVTDKWGGGLSVYNVKTSDVPAAPAVTAAAVVENAAAPEGKIVSTSTYTKDGVVYEVAIEEVYVTVTVDAAAKHRRHAHARRHGVRAN